MVEPSDGTLGSFLKSGAGIFLIVFIALSVLFSLFAMAAGIGLSIYAESTQNGGSLSAGWTNTCTTGDDSAYSYGEDSQTASDGGYDFQDGQTDNFDTVPTRKETVLSTIYFAGSGSMTTQEFTLEKGVARFTIRAEGGDGNFLFTLIDMSGEEMKELYYGGATAEPFVRTITIPYYDYLRVDVEAGGNWSITIEQLEIERE